MEKLKILFAGTSDIAVSTLTAVCEAFEVVGVLTATDKRSGRSKCPVSPPVKIEAQRLGIPVLQCDHVNKAEREAVERLKPNMLLSFSFGRIFGPKFLGLFEKTMNIHPSPLPVARGPSPVQAAILSASSKWAISFQEIGLQMDCGRIYDVLEFNLNGKETTVTLSQAISEMASKHCVEVLSSLKEPQAQVGDPTYCRLIDKADGALDFNRTARENHSIIRAMYDWPKASTTLGGEMIFITGVWGGYGDLDSEPSCEGILPGTVMEIIRNKGMKVSCSDKAIWITKVQFPTKKEISFMDLANARKNIRDMKFGG